MAANDKPFGVSNIKTHVPLVLDLDQLNYDAWSELFTTHCDSFGVLSHLTTTTDDALKTPTWRRLDSLVKAWIYGSISTSLLQTVLTPQAEAAAVWKALQELFHDNKEARAMELENELRTLELGSLTVSEYFKRIKVISDLLTNIGAPIDEKTLVMYALNGVEDRYEQVASIIRHSKTRPSLLEARSMFIMEEARQTRRSRGNGHNTHNGRDNPSAPNALMAAATHPSNARSRSNRPNNGSRGTPPLCRNFQQGRCTFGERCRFTHARQSGNFSQVYSNNMGTNNMQPWGGFYTATGSHALGFSPQPNPLMYRAPRPTLAQVQQPYGPPAAAQQLQGFSSAAQQPSFGPTSAQQPYFGPNSAAQQHSQVLFSGLTGPPSAQQGILGPRPQNQPSWPTAQLTELPQAYQSDILSYAPDNGWYMDTGATSHLAKDPGFSDPATPSPM